MPPFSFQAIIRDALPLDGPLGRRYLLSVAGATARPELPCTARIAHTPDWLTLLEIMPSPTLWLLSEVTLVAQAQGQADWRAWPGRLLVVETAQ
ncbi:hypothetical protein [Deinococcus sp.]|uniref:hypothetical protein n=1 Tax=Deinococcus sp. TaxID=47478 RepID=UPI003CC6C7AF